MHVHRRRGAHGSTSADPGYGAPAGIDDKEHGSYFADGNQIWCDCRGDVMPAYHVLLLDSAAEDDDEGC